MRRELRGHRRRQFASNSTSQSICRAGSAGAIGIDIVQVMTIGFAQEWLNWKELSLEGSNHFGRRHRDTTDLALEIVVRHTTERSVSALRSWVGSASSTNSPARPMR